MDPISIISRISDSEITRYPGMSARLIYSSDFIRNGNSWKLIVAVPDTWVGGLTQEDADLASLLDIYQEDTINSILYISGKCVITKGSDEYEFRSNLLSNAFELDEWLDEIVYQMQVEWPGINMKYGTYEHRIIYPEMHY